ncbi:glycosyltransferase family 4 protein [Paraburkholderia agricolaris]|uniref:glycosyltransferase family 4 protein n=1 Tax=Paraburkholderia agricolaris TaxID=2152888 RepID=UPI0038BA6131
MKIAMAGQNYFVRGGSDKVLIETEKMLRAYGHEVAPFCGADKENQASEWLEFFPKKEVSISSPRLSDVVRYMYNFDAKKAVRRFIREFGPDVFHCHIYYGKLSASILAEVKSHAIPLVQTIHEYKLVCPTYQLSSNGSVCEKCANFKFHNVLTHRCNKGSVMRSAASMVESYVSYMFGSVEKIDRFIAVSDFQRNKVVSMGVPEHKVSTIHNFVDISEIVPEYRAGRYFIYFGRVEKEKGIWVLLAAFKKIKNINLLIVGVGGAYEDAKEYCRKNAMSNVTFFGFATRDQLGGLVRGATASIVPSVWYETFGLSAAESLAYGKPVIAADIGGLPEVLSAGDDSTLIEAGNVDALITAVEEMAYGKLDLEKMGRVGRKNVESKFSRPAHYEKLSALYRSVMS